MAADPRMIQVCADWVGLGGPVPMGRLVATQVRGKEVFSFQYDRLWLEAGHATPLDPGLRPYRGAQYLPDGRSNFGLFLDSSPDRWGRVLIQRREALLAREEGRRPSRLAEHDYLLGVYDGHRLGGLRFRIEGGPFLDDNAELASPPWTSLRALEQASLKLERIGTDGDPPAGKWLRMLIAPGRSLGGARPKASVLDTAGRLWIAKFPSDHDSDDIGAWEGIVHTLAGRAGLDLAEARSLKCASRHHTFVTQRFDRTKSGERIHFASAMTLLERTDGEEGASYLDLAEVLIRSGAHPARDLEELWRRMVFFVCVSNVDDHLRNHGFLLEPSGAGWSLAPAYDMNPVAAGRGLSLNISETDNAQDLALTREVSGQFRLKGKRAKEIEGEVTSAVRTWRATAAAAGLSRPAQERMTEAFRVADEG